MILDSIIAVLLVLIIMSIYGYLLTWMLILLTKSKEKMLPKLINCAKEHGNIPFSFVCKHLVGVPMQKWYPIAVVDGREVEWDYLCMSCNYNYKKNPFKLVGEMDCVCFLCVQDLRKAEVEG